MRLIYNAASNPVCSADLRLQEQRMEVELQAKNVELTERVRDYVDKKMGKLERYLQDIRATRVDLRHGVTRSQGEVYTAQMTAFVDKQILRAEEMHPDLLAAIDLASDKLHRQIKRYKDRRVDRWHDHSKPVPLYEPPEDEVDEDETRILRRKRFEVYAMDEGEAIEQIELLGHDFFLYRDADDGDIRLIYRRKGGGLGLIEPVTA
jgi:putative sigma-54 modulation protein